MRGPAIMFKQNLQKFRGRRNPEQQSDRGLKSKMGRFLDRVLSWIPLNYNHCKHVWWKLVDLKTWASLMPLALVADVLLD